MQTTLPSRKYYLSGSVRMHGIWLAAAQVVWVLAAGISLVALVISIPVGYERMTVPCLSEAVCAPDQVLLDVAQRLSEQGLSLQFYALQSIVVSAGFSLICLAAAVLIFLRRPKEAMAWYVSLTLVFFGVFITELVDGLGYASPVWRWIVDLGSSAGWVLFACMLYLFPTGRFVPGWTRWMALAWVMTQLPYYIDPYSPFNMGTWPLELQFPLILGLFGTGLWAQVYRFRRVSSPAQRQQTKWVLFGLHITVLSILFLSVIPDTFFPERAAPGTILAMALDGLSALAILILPLSIAMAVMHNRLWDIDLLINRTLVYGLLSLMLGLVYLGGVLVLQEAIAGLSGGAGSSLATVATTMLLAALFTPLRRRIQLMIDLRFYRRRYNAEQAVARLGNALRSEVDLNRITDHLVEVVQETVQPETVWVWLRENPAAQDRFAGGD